MHSQTVIAIDQTALFIDGSSHKQRSGSWMFPYLHVTIACRTVLRRCFCTPVACHVIDLPRVLYCVTHVTAISRHDNCPQPTTIMWIMLVAQPIGIIIYLEYILSFILPCMHLLLYCSLNFYPIKNVQMSKFATFDVRHIGLEHAESNIWFSWKLYRLNFREFVLFSSNNRENICPHTTSSAPFLDKHLHRRWCRDGRTSNKWKRWII